MNSQDMIASLEKQIEKLEQERLQALAGKDQMLANANFLSGQAEAKEQSKVDLRALIDILQRPSEALVLPDAPAEKILNFANHAESPK